MNSSLSSHKPNPSHSHRPFRPENIDIQLRHNTKDHPETLHKPIDSHAQHPVRRRAVGSLQNRLRLVRVLLLLLLLWPCQVLTRWMCEGEGASHGRGQFGVDFEGLEGRRGETVGWEGEIDGSGFC